MKINGFSFSIFHKLLITILLVALVPLSSVWFISRHNAINDWNVNINNQLDAAAQSLVTQTNNWVDYNHRVMRQNASTDAILSMDKAQQDPVLASIKATYEWVNLAFTLDTQGNNIGRSDTRDPNPTDKRQFFRDVMAGAPLGHQVVMGITAGKPALILGSPIKNKNGKLQGAIAMGMTLEKLSNTITTYRIGETGFAFLVESDGKVIAHPKIDLSKERQDFSTHPAFLSTSAAQQGRFVYTEDDKEIIAFTRKTALGWNLVIQQDYDEAFAAVKAADRNAIILFGITLVLAIIVAYVVSRRFAQPILHLTEVANEISRGKLDVKIEETNRGDEIGALAQAIDRMGISIRLAMERLKRK